MAGLHFRDANIDPLAYSGFAWTAAAADTDVIVGPGSCTDEGGEVRISVTAASTTVQSDTTGLNGMDTGAPGTNDLYLYATTNKETPGFILSESSTWAGVTAPAGYTWGRLIGFLPRPTTNQVTTTRIECHGGADGEHFWEYDSATWLVASTTGTGAWVEADASAYCPSGCDWLYWHWAIRDEDNLNLGPDAGSTYTNGSWQTVGSGADNNQLNAGNVWLRSPSGSIFWKMGAGAITWLRVEGFRMNMIENRGQ